MPLLCLLVLQLHLSPRVFQELQHTNMAELAKQAPHLLPASSPSQAGDSGTSPAEASAGGDAATTAQGSECTSGRHSLVQGGSSAYGSIARSGSSGGRAKWQMHDSARSHQIVDAMELSPEQRKAFAEVQNLLFICCFMRCKSVRDLGPFSRQPPCPSAWISLMHLAKVWSWLFIVGEVAGILFAKSG